MLHHVIPSLKCNSYWFSLWNPANFKKNLWQLFLWPMFLMLQMKAVRIGPPPTVCWPWRWICAVTGTTAKPAATPAVPSGLQPHSPEWYHGYPLPVVLQLGKHTSAFPEAIITVNNGKKTNVGVHLFMTRTFRGWLMLIRYLPLLQTEPHVFLLMPDILLVCPFIFISQL